MSYLASVALQGAVYRRLRMDEVLASLVGDAIYDAMPVEMPSGVYISLGPEEVSEAGDATTGGAQHDFMISVLSGTDRDIGFGAVKAAAVAVAEALEHGRMELERGHLVGMWFLRARARRVENSAARRVDLTFRARIDLD